MPWKPSSVSPTDAWPGGGALEFCEFGRPGGALSSFISIRLDLFRLYVRFFPFGTSLSQALWSSGSQPVNDRWGVRVTRFLLQLCFWLEFISFIYALRVPSVGPG